MGTKSEYAKANRCDDLYRLAKQGTNKFVNHDLVKLSLTIVKYLQTVPESDIKWLWWEQLMTSVTSAAANFIEGEGRGSTGELNFAAFSRGSAAECRYWAQVSEDIQLIKWCDQLSDHLDRFYSKKFKNKGVISEDS